MSTCSRARALKSLQKTEGIFGLDWGSPLIAAQLPTKFQKLHLVESEKRRFDALGERLKKVLASAQVQLLRGDANDVASKIVQSIPTGALSVAFLDPYGLHLRFNTLRQLANRKMDLIIFFPDHTDALRNWRMLYEDDQNSNLDLVLNSAPWRQQKEQIAPSGWSDMLTRLYVTEIKKLGYLHFDYERICRTDGRHLYKLIFCSKDKAGATIWANTARKNRQGQLGLDFK